MTDLKELALLLRAELSRSETAKGDDNGTLSLPA